MARTRAVSRSAGAILQRILFEYGAWNRSGDIGCSRGKVRIAAPEVDSAETRIGLGDGWRISPLALVHAYAELALRTGEPRVSEDSGGSRTSRAFRHGERDGPRHVSQNRHGACADIGAAKSQPRNRWIYDGAGAGGFAANCVAGCGCMA